MENSVNLASVIFGKLCIPFSSIESGISSFTFSIAHPDLKLDEGCHFPNQVAVEANVQRIGDDYLAAVTAESVGKFICDRCGAEFQRSVRGEIQALFTFDAEKAMDTEADDVKLLPSMAVEIDIAQDALDALVLAVPQKRLCREECKGLCARCGVNLNEACCLCSDQDIDPRWEKLKGIMSDNNHEE